MKHWIRFVVMYVNFKKQARVIGGPGFRIVITPGREVPGKGCASPGAAALPELTSHWLRGAFSGERRWPRVVAWTFLCLLIDAAPPEKET